MKAFLDFEASSLSKSSYPIEVAWVFEDGRSESHLVAPAADWSDWDVKAEAIHGIDRAELLRDGIAHDVVARRMVEALSGHELFASAPSWDGKWLSVLLRSAGIPRHALRLRDTDEAMRATVAEILRDVHPRTGIDVEAHNIIARVSAKKSRQPAHRALADAIGEQRSWLEAKAAADILRGSLGG